MNRDYSVRMAPESEATTDCQDVQPEELDYLVTVCAVCLLPGDVTPVDLGCMITYAHGDCL